MADDRRTIEAAILALESHRGTLGDAVVDVAVATLLAQLADGPGASAAAEPRLVPATVLFVDVVGSTSIGRTLDPEDIHDVMNQLAGRFTEMVKAHHGRVVKYTGDGLLAAFGVDDAHEQGAELAVRAGLAMLDALEGFRRDGSLAATASELNVRIGLDTGSVLIGGGVEAESNIRGTTVDMAARMEQHAPTGGLRISHNTYRHVGALFDVVEEPPITVKGVDGPLRTYLVLRARPHMFRAPQQGIDGVVTRMVGRRRELASLQESFEHLGAEPPMLRSHLVVGEAGVGKSRLLYELESWADRQPTAHHLLAGRAQVSMRHEPYGLLRDVLLRWLLAGSQSDDSPGAAREQFVGAVRPFLPDDGDSSAHLLGHLLGLDFAASPHVAGIASDHQQLRGRAVGAVSELIRRLATDPVAGAPVLVFLEDMHWADDGTLDVIRHVTRVNADVPVLVVATSRPELLERRPDLAGPGTATSLLELVPLDAGESDELVGMLLHRLDVIPENVRRLVATSADGVPLFMEEVVKMLVDEGAFVVDEDGSWHVGDDRLELADVPSTLTGVLQARLDALDARERETAQRASVIGHVFWAEAVTALGGDATAFDTLERRGLVVARGESSIPGLHELTFRHHLLHQFTYRSLLKRDRRRNHELAAAWLEATLPDRRGEYLVAIGEHHERAGAAPRAVDCYALAAAHAAGRDARAVVLDLVDRALALVTEDDIQSRWRLVATREQVLALGDDRARHDDDLDALEALAESSGDDLHRMEACLRRARALVDQGEYQRAASVGRRAVEDAERSGDNERLADGCRLVATAMWRMGDLDAALRLGDRSLAAAEALGPSRTKAASLRILATIEADAGDIARSETLTGLSLEISRAVGDRTGEASALTSIGCMSRTWGALDDARRSFEGTLRLARETGWTYGESLALVNLAELHALAGDHAAALATGRAAAGIAVLSGARDLEAAALLTAGYAEVALGDLAAARATFSRSRELFRANDSPHYAHAPTTGLAVVHHLEGDDTTALALIEEVMRDLDEGGTLAGVDLRMETFLRCYEVLRACGDHRAGRVLATAVTVLADVADRFDEERRQRYLHGAPEHHAVMAAWAASIPG